MANSNYKKLPDGRVQNIKTGTIVNGMKSASTAPTIKTQIAAPNGSVHTTMPDGTGTVKNSTAPSGVVLPQAGTNKAVTQTNTGGNARTYNNSFGLPAVPTAQYTPDKIKAMVADVMQSYRPVIDTKQRQLDTQQSQALDTSGADMESRGLSRSDYAVTRNDQIKEAASTAMSDFLGQLQSQASGQAIDLANLSLNEQKIIEDALTNRVQLELQNRGINLQEKTADANFTGMYKGKETMQSIQNKIQNAISEAGVTGTYNGKDTMQKTNADREYALNQEQYNLTKALQTLQTLGKADEFTAKYLGIPVGTPSWQAQNAVDQRKQELEMQRRSLEVQREQIDATKDAASASRDSANLNALTNLMITSGVVPKGMGQYLPGAVEGQPFDRPEDLSAMQKTGLTDAVIAKYKTDDTTASKIVDLSGKTYDQAKIQLEVAKNNNSKLDSTAISNAIKDMYPNEVYRDAVMQEGEKLLWQNNNNSEAALRAAKAFGSSENVQGGAYQRAGVKNEDVIKYIKGRTVLGYNRGW